MNKVHYSFGSKEFSIWYIVVALLLLAPVFYWSTTTIGLIAAIVIYRLYYSFYGIDFLDNHVVIVHPFRLIDRYRELKYSELISVQKEGSTHMQGADGRGAMWYVIKYKGIMGTKKVTITVDEKLDIGLGGFLLLKKKYIKGPVNVL